MKTIIALLLSTSVVFAHSFYPPECCSDRDCYEIEDTDVQFTQQGWLIKDTGEIIAFSKSRLSPDGKFHRCSYGGLKTNKTICFWAKTGAS